ncbi:MAG: sigma-70 family RNA polymerase sigma factor [Pirellulaceae bacterium]
MPTQLSHLSRIDTPWSIVRQAHDGSEAGVQQARQVLFERYGGAARRYLGAVLRDDDAADELFQEFALRLVRGAFCGANPERGRFRAFVKTALHNLVVDFRRRAARRERQPQGTQSLDAGVRLEPTEDLFVQAWRQELLERTWASLHAAERAGTTPYYTALRLLVDEGEPASADVAAKLASKLGRDVTPGHARVIVHRARQLFADLLVSEVAGSLETASAEELEQELGELKLLDYCQHALERRRQERLAAVPQPRSPS